VRKSGHKAASWVLVAVLVCSFRAYASPGAGAETPSPSPSPTSSPSPAPTPAATASPTATPQPAAPSPGPSPNPYSSDPIGYIDAPAAGSTVFDGTLAVWGWAIDRNASGSTPGIDSVALYLDGAPGTGALLGTATYGLGRTDVGSYFGDARWNDSGWQFAWTIHGLIWGNHTIYAALHSSVTGATTSLRQTVLYIPPPPDPAPPRVPASYSVPAGAISVSDSVGLLSALATTTPQDIVLASGVYDNATAFENQYGHHIYSATLGGAVFNAGLIIGSNSDPGGALLQGVAFDVSDPSKTFQNSIVHVWGTGRGTRISDSTFNGNNAVGHAILARQPDGLVIQRVRARNLTVNGITVDANDQNLTVATPALLEDLDIANVSFAVPKSSNGTAEACVWLGNSGTVRRALIRNCAWTGVWTGTAATGSVLEDLDIDLSAAGVYIEHFTSNSTFQRMRIGANTWTGVACEWASASWGSRPACTDDVIQDSTIASADTGVILDVGTTRTALRHLKFVGEGTAAIKDFSGVNNTYTDNDYRGIASGAVPIEN
jgi:hypothetical protein